MSKQFEQLVFLGRQPNIGLAELESVLGKGTFEPVTKDIVGLHRTSAYNFDNFGSAVKTAQVMAVLKTSSHDFRIDDLEELIASSLVGLSDSKIHLGISCYGLLQSIPVKTARKQSINLKKSLRQSGFSVRLIVPNGHTLITAQIIHNRLFQPNRLEISLVGLKDTVVVTRTTWVQDIQSYAARDQARPSRDAKVGMLPPKLAQTIVNLGLPCSATLSGALLDPFVGTGVVLQEAALINNPNITELVGTDLEPRMIDLTRANLKWLHKSYAVGLLDNIRLEQADASSHTWEGALAAVAAETYLGPPLLETPAAQELDSIVDELNQLHERVLRNLAAQLPAGATMCLAVPAWRLNATEFKSLPCLDLLTDMGYNLREFEWTETKSLIYARADQIVARQLIVIDKK